MKDYSKGKIYKIVCNITALIYIGSTCEPTLARRLAKHVSDYNRWKNGEKHFITSFKIIEGGNYDIILIEDCPCTRQDELHKRERFYIESINCVNKFIPSRTKKEYRVDNSDLLCQRSKLYRELNHEKVLEYLRNYYQDNKETLIEKQKQYTEKNKEKLKQRRSENITCSCGSKYTKCHKARHEKTKTHQDNVTNDQN
jgi:hypothetical protein